MPKNTETLEQDFADAKQSSEFNYELNKEYAFKARSFRKRSGLTICYTTDGPEVILGNAEDFSTADCFFITRNDVTVYATFRGTKKVEDKTYAKFSDISLA